MRWPLVKVCWVDSTSPRMGWVNIAEWEGVGSLDCVSVGYLIAEDEKTKTIAPHLAYPEDDEQCQGNGIITIPSAAILSMEQLSTNVSSSSVCAVQDRFSGHPESVQPSA